MARARAAALAGSLGAACARLDWIEAPDARSEARAIALALRGAAEEGARAALVTPDRSLARRVTAELDRWGLIPDDSAGRPLALTPPGVLLRRLAALPGAPLTPQDLLALLKHPLVSSALGARRAHLELTARLELKRLRGGAPWIDWDDLAAWAGTQKRPERRRAGPTGCAPALAPLAAGGVAPLAEHVARHRAAAEALAAGVEGAGAHGLWEQEAGRQARALLDALAAEADAGAPLGPAEYRALIQHADGGARRARGGGGDPPRHRHLGHARGAGAVGRPGGARRAQRGDLAAAARRRSVAQPRDAPHRSGCRARSGSSGSPPTTSSRRSGRERVILTRAARDAEAPTVASRWLLRLENLLLGLGAEGAAALDGRARAAARACSRTRGALDRPAATGAARPPAVARARRPRRGRRSSR